MIKQFSRLYHRIFPMPSTSELAREELAEAQRELMLAQSQRDYSVAMVQFNTRRVSRLQHQLEALRG